MIDITEEIQLERSRHHWVIRQEKMRRLNKGDVQGRWRKYIYALTIVSSTVTSLNVFAIDSAAKPWLRNDAIIIVDPYEGNDSAISWKKAASDLHLRAVIHRASIGMRVDNAFITTAGIATTHGLKVGAFHLGLRGDPIAQADIFLKQVGKSRATFLALDIEEIGGNNMSLADAERFIRYIYERTGRYPALYGSQSVVKTISEKYSGDSVFAKTPLWIVSTSNAPPVIPTNVWDRITLWQFSSELNCPKHIRAQHKDYLCDPYRPYIVPGTRYDLDVDILLGDKSLFDELFSSLPGG